MSNSSIPTSSHSSYISNQIDITIESLGGLGDGIATHGSKPVFVPKSVTGDKLRVKITSQTSEVHRAEIIKILEPSPQRVPAPCPHFDACGGCGLQMLEASAYKEFKTRIAVNAFRQAGYDDAKIETIFLPPNSRRRTEFKWNGKNLAYMGVRSHTKVSVHTCLILLPALERLIEPLNTLLAALPYAKDIATVSLTQADNAIGLAIVVNHPFTASIHENLLQMLAEKLGLGSVIVTDGRATLANVEYDSLTMNLAGIDVELPHDAFLQATSEGQKLLTEFATSHMKDSTANLDLFCGIGTYSFALAKQGKLLAVENDQPMVHALREAARTKNMPNMTAEKRDLFISPLKPHEIKPYTACVINPPRAGAKTQCEQLAASDIKTIVMISCNPGTFARDARILKDAGYTLQHAMALDQFVWSGHLEIAAHFTKS